MTDEHPLERRVAGRPWARDEEPEVYVDLPDDCPPLTAKWETYANALVTADPDAHAVYVRRSRREVKKTTFVETLVGIDRDADGRVVGLEILHTVPPDEFERAWAGVPRPGE